MDKQDYFKNVVGNISTTLYAAILSKIKECLSCISEKSVDCQMVFRYIDDDLEQDVIRVKQVRVDGDHLVCVSDTWNREGYAADVHFDDDWAFEDEGTTVLDDQNIPVLNGTFPLDFLVAVYNEVTDYAIPRALSRQAEKD